jgi:hypothetical protein
VDHPLRLHHTELDPRRLRLAVAALAGVAAVELVLLVVAGGALLSRSDTTATAHGAAAKAHRADTASSKPAKANAAAATELPRRKVAVVVLNGNGRQGAAGRAASRITHRGYRVRAVANAPSSSYPQSIVMYRPGFAPEAQRLAKDLGVKIVSPLDGMRPKQLHGAHAVFILGG